MNINDLPHELLEKIFLNLIWADEYLRLTEICKNFKEVIENSSRLMQELVILWDEERKDPEVLVASTRKYSTIRFTGLDINHMPYLLQFLERQPIKRLNISECSFSALSMWTIIYLARRTLEVLDICAVDIYEECNMIPIYMPNLKTLQILADDEFKEQILGLFVLPLNLRSILYCCSDKRPLSVEGLSKYRDLLVNSAELKALQLSSDLAITLFSDSSFAHQAKFKLEMCEMDARSILTDEQISNSAIFFGNQTCMKELELGDFTITSESLKAILSLPVLKKIYLYRTIFKVFRKIYIKNTSIKSVSCNQTVYTVSPIIDLSQNTLQDEFAICAIINGCLSVKELFLCGFDMTENVVAAITKHPMKLKHERENYIRSTILD